MLRELLDNFWIVRNDNKEKYFSIKEDLKNYKSFIYNKLGYNLILNPQVIKLEKIPAKAEPWMGINDFNRKEEYIFFTLLLMYLEQKENKYQFILSELTEYIKENYVEGNVIKWEEYRNRISIIRVLDYAEKMGFIIIEEFEATSFRSNEGGEALITNTGISRYFMRHFNEDINDYEGIQDFECIENTTSMDGLEEEELREIKNYVYRQLVVTPGLYKKDNEKAFVYLKKYGEKNIVAEIEAYLGASLHLHQSAAFVIFDEEDTVKNTFPRNSGISDMVLQFNKLIGEKVLSKELIPSKEDVIEILSVEFSELVRELRNRFYHGWNKKYRYELSFKDLEEELKSYMTNNGLIRENRKQGTMHLLPLIGKIVGDYIDDKEEVKGER